MKPGLPRAIGLALLIALAGVLLNRAHVAMPLIVTLALIGAFIAMAPHVGVRLLDAIVLRVRGWFWAEEQGQFHEFAGTPLRIEDDGRHVWIGAEGLQRAIGQLEPEDATAARHAGRWKRTAQGQLMLRADAVVQNLTQGPRRNEPRIQRLRLYLERQVLFPAARRARGH